MQETLSTRVRRWPWRRIVRGALLLLLVGLSARVLWITSHTETGYQTLRQHWRDATVGLVRGEYVEVQYREPAQQAEFWLAEVDRIVGEHTLDTEVLIGAALVLDDSCSGYQLNYGDSFGQPDWEQIEQAEDSFQAMCAARCLELTEIATGLEPDQKQWWQLRALLLVPPDNFSNDTTPRDPRWREILRECSAHDPDNALYKYLATMFCWNASGRLGYARLHQDLRIIHPETFAQGTEHYEQAQAKPHFEFDTTGYWALSKLLNHSRLPLAEHAAMLSGRNPMIRSGGVTRNVYDWQEARAQDQLNADNVLQAMHFYRQQLHMADQCLSESRQEYFDYLPLLYRRYSLEAMAQLAKKHSESFPAETQASLVAQHRAAWLDYEVHTQASLNLEQRLSGSPIPPPLIGNLGEELQQLLVEQLPLMIVGLLLVIGLAAAASRIGSTDDEYPTTGLFSEWLMLLTAAITTTIMFGLVPAKVISYDMQTWLLIGSIVLMLLFLFSLMLLSLIRQGFRFTLSSMFLGQLLLIAICVALLVMWNAELVIPARPWRGLRVETWENMLPADEQWLLSVVQWKAYWGGLIMVGLWLVLLSIVLQLKVRFGRDHEVLHAHSYRRQVLELLKTLGRASTRLAVMLLLLYLAVVPGPMLITEQNYQQQMSYYRESSQLDQRFEQELHRLRGNEREMQQLRDWIEQQQKLEASLNN